MNIRLFFVTTAILLGAPAVAQEATTPTVEAAEATSVAPAKKAKPKKITDRRHPDYVRCRSEAIIGSLSKKRRVCMTNREWALANREGNRKTSQFVEDMQVGSNASN